VITLVGYKIAGVLRRRREAYGYEVVVRLRPGVEARVAVSPASAEWIDAATTTLVSRSTACSGLKANTKTR
jgi:hypothetical protein